VSIARDGFHLLRKSSIVATLITQVLFKQLLIRTAVNGLNIAGNKVSSFQDKYVSGARSAIIVSMQYAWVHQQ